MRPSGDTDGAKGVGGRLIDVARLAEGQRGLVTHKQLRTLGLSPAGIQRLRRQGYLRTLHRGVYAVGHLALPPLARELAAVLACSPNAYLSHHSAAALWGILRIAGPIEVTVIGRNTGPRTGVIVHRATTLETTVRNRIPVTTPVQTLIDLAGSASPLQLARAFDEGRTQGLVSPDAVRTAVDRHPRRPGARRLRALTADDRGTGVSYEGTEELMLALIRRAGLPAPDRNVALGRWSIDMYWPVQRVAVELDGYGFHTTRSAFERDHEKDHALRARDIDLLRFTWHQVHGQPEQTLVRLATALARPRRAA